MECIKMQVKKDNTNQIITSLRLQIIIGIINAIFINIAINLLMPKVWPNFPVVEVCILVGLLPILALIDLALFVKFKQLILNLLWILVIDGIILTTILYLIGEMRYLFVFIYLMPIMMSAPIFPLRRLIILPIVYSLFFTTMVFLEYLGMIQIIDTPHLEITIFYILLVSTVTIILIHAITIIIGRTMDKINERDWQLRLTYKELQDSQDKLVKVEKLAAVSQIAAEAAHEVKNPLQVIKSGLYYLKITHKEDIDAQQTIQQMDSAVGRATGFINDLLNFSKPLELKTTKCQVNKLIKEAIKELPEELLSNIDVTQNLASDLPEINVDSDRIRQVLVNLVKNAAEAMGGVKSKKLKVKSERGGDFIKIGISDTGKGITTEDISKIFEPFYTTRGKGIGLGLAICQRLIEAHQGRIEVDSEVGKGTTFVVFLPI
ncbi:MAG: ATP-binding protein [bacterium]